MSKKHRRRIAGSCNAVLDQAGWLIGLRNGQRLLARMLALRNWLTRGLAGGALVAALALAPARADGPFVDQNVVPPGRPAFVDIDNDGDQDLFVGLSNGGVAYLHNDGDTTTVDFTPQAGNANPLAFVNVGTNAAPAFVDIDNDGDFDAFIGAYDGEVRFYENTGSAAAPAFTAQTPLPAALDIGFGNDSIPAFVDIDADGDFDAFVGNRFGPVLFFQNNGTATAADFSDQTGVSNPLFGFDFGYATAPAFVDIDNDGDFDAFVGNFDGVVQFFRNAGSAAAPGFSAETGAANPFNGVDVGYTAALSFADLDADADFDAFLGAKNDRLLLQRNTGTPAAPAFSAEPTFPLGTANVGGLARPTFLDIDNDGDFDAFVGERFGTVAFFRNNGSPTLPDFRDQSGVTNPLAGIDVGGGSAPTFVDIDGDNDPDLFVGESFGTIAYYQNNSGTFSLQTGAGNPLNAVDVGFSAIPTFVDIDADGDFDAFIGNNGGDIRFFLNTGSAAAPTLVAQSSGANPLGSVDVGVNSAPTFVDLDNDGDQDAIIGELDGRLRYFENTGSASAATFTERIDLANPFAPFDVGGNAAPALVDIDADGDADAFVGDDDGLLTFFLNTAVPAAPPDLAATPAGADQVDLSWSDNNTVETAYVVERSLDGTTGWTAIASLPADSSSFSDTGLSEVTTYFYRLQAQNNNFSSPFTGVVSATTSLIPPDGLSATPLTPTSVALSWNDNSANETGYVVERSLDGSSYSTIATLPAGSTSFSDTGLSPGTTYFYQVRAVRDGAPASAPTAPVSVATGDFRVYLPTVIR